MGKPHGDFVIAELHPYWTGCQYISNTIINITNITQPYVEACTSAYVTVWGFNLLFSSFTPVQRGF